MGDNRVHGLRQIRALLQMHGRASRAGFIGVYRRSRLMMATLALFIAAYLVLGYLLLYEGFAYVHRFPGIGILIGDRVFHLIFVFFFVMLVFSNMIINYTALFRSRETEWLLTLPIDHRLVFSWKVFESMVHSSWALVFLSAPLLAAYGKVNEAPLLFYPLAVLALIPFVAVPAALAAWVLLLLVRGLSFRWVRWGIIAAGVALVGWGVFKTLDISKTLEQEGGNPIASFNQLLRHTRVSTNPFLPSFWMTQVLLKWSKGLSGQGGFYFLLTLSYALLGMVLVHAPAGRWFFPLWARIQLRGSARRSRRAPGVVSTSPGDDSDILPPPSRLPVLNRATLALMRKDALIFVREPAQWLQILIVLGLLLVYILNIRNLGYDFSNPFWTTVISYLNLGACALTLTTMTTRFVFPQFSLEGQRMWILGLAPFRMEKVLWQKFWQSLAVTTLLSGGLMCLSGLMLQLPPHKIARFVVAISGMCLALNGLSMGLGALFPNFKQDNPARIVSGFGGTLCLILSFIYILLFVTCLAIPSALQLTGSSTGTLARMPAIPLLAHATAAALSIAACAVPMGLALTKVKRLHFLKIL